MMKKLLPMVLVALGMLTAGRAMAIPVELELLLLVDVSGSVSAAEYNLQRGGYASAFQNPMIHNLIASRPNGIAVAYAEWSGSGQQSLQVGWTLLTDAATSNAFGLAIGAAARAFSGQTAPGSAINWGAPLFNNNGYEGNRMVIDVSGDGPQNQGADTKTAAAAAKALGITVNGLPIGAGVQAFYQNNIVTPGGGFLQLAADFDDFEGAVVTKIGREISNPIPEPSTYALMGAGLVALLAARRRRA